MDANGDPKDQSIQSWSADLVSALNPDPSRGPQDSLVMFGIPAESTREGYRRLYLTLELNEYVDYPDGKVLYTQSYRNSINGLSGTLVWIDKQAEVIRGSTGAETGGEKTIQLSTWKRQATFLQGLIVGTRAGRVGSLVPPGAQLPEFPTLIETIVVRWTYWPGCTMLPGCTLGDDCGSFAVDCCSVGV